jgi:hypothetical protein
MEFMPSSARINTGLGKVAARLVLPVPASPQIVMIGGRDAGFVIVDKTLMLTSLGFAGRDSF